MKNISPESKLLYVSQVLGINSYLCPQPVYKTRSVTGGVPRSVVVVVFRPPSLDQSVLLKKIFAAVEQFSFSLLTLKEGWDPSIFSGMDFSHLKGLFVFGKGAAGPSLEGSSQPEREGAFEDLIRNSLWGKTLAGPEGDSGSSGSAQALPVARPPCVFCRPLSDYEGHSSLVQKRKQELWGQLQHWKKGFSD